MRALVEARARELGFDACRFTTAEPPTSADHFQIWLKSERHGEMAYLARNAHKRIAPDQVLAGARSIIVLAASYHRSKPLAPDAFRGVADGSQCGEVARYARYADYHDVLGDRLRQLTQYVNELGGAGTRSLWYVDTGPLLERDFAQRAGLGFVGKHTNLISREMGNWLFLAEIITTLEFAPGLPEKNRCGSCIRCLAACPTQAITAPFELDARRCISYLTIELKGRIPVELRPSIGRRIYGCDDCLAICPWNRFAREGKAMQDQVRPDLDDPDLLELLSLDDTEFKRRFAGTPLLRTRRRGFLRNVCVALGNVGDSSALPALHRACSDPEPLIAEHARWAVERIEARHRGETG